MIMAQVKSDSDESNEKWSKSGYIFKEEPMRFACELNVIRKYREVEDDSKIFGKMAQYSHHQLGQERLGKIVWEGRQKSGVLF